MGRAWLLINPNLFILGVVWQKSNKFCVVVLARLTRLPTRPEYNHSHFIDFLSQVSIFDRYDVGIAKLPQASHFCYILFLANAR